MSRKFNYEGLASIIHMNTRKEGPEDDKYLTIDLKLTAIADKSIFDYFDDRISEALYTDIGAVRNTMIGPITFNYELEHYALEVMARYFYEVRIKKFILQPMDGRLVETSFQVSFKPMADDVARLAEYLQDAIAIKVKPMDQELEFE